MCSSPGLFSVLCVPPRCSRWQNMPTADVLDSLCLRQAYAEFQVAGWVLGGASRQLTRDAGFHSFKRQSMSYFLPLSVVRPTFLCSGPSTMLVVPCSLLTGQKPLQTPFPAFFD